MSKKLDRRFPLLHYDYMCGLDGGFGPRDLAWVKDVLASTRGRELLAEGKELSIEGMLRAQGRPPAYALAVEAMWRYEQSGQQNYVLGPALQEVFDNTSLSGVPQDAIKLPHRCFYVALEDSNIDLWGGPDTRWHQCGGFYVCSTSPTKLFLLVWGKPNARSAYHGDDASHWFRFDLDEVFGKHKDIEEYMRYTVAKTKSVDDAAWIAAPAREQQKSLESSLKTARLAFNLIMHLQTKNLNSEVVTPELRKVAFVRDFGKKNPSKGAARLAHRDLLKAGSHTVTYLDQSREAREKRAKQGGSGRRTWVAGHWQRYWVGSGAEKRTEWRHKEPFVRSKDASEEVPRRYYVGGTKD